MRRLIGWIVDVFLGAAKYVYETVFGKMILCGSVVLLVGGCATFGDAIGAGIARRAAESVVAALPDPPGPETPTEELIALAVSTAAIMGHRYWYHRRK